MVLKLQICSVYVGMCIKNVLFAKHSSFIHQSGLTSGPPAGEVSHADLLIAWGIKGNSQHSVLGSGIMGQV